MSTIYWQGTGGTYNNPASGDYGAANNWLGGQVPGYNDDVMFNNSGNPAVYDVTVSAQYYLDSLSVGFGTILQVNDRASLVVTPTNSATSTITNDGEIIVKDAASNSFSDIVTFDTTLTFEGIGAVILMGGEIDSTDGGSGLSSIENVSNVMTGYGYVTADTLYNDAGAKIVANQGAAPLVISSNGPSATVYNNGLLEAVDDGTDGAGNLTIYGSVYSNNASTGTIASHQDATVDLESGEDLGQSITADGSGDLIVGEDDVLGLCTTTLSDSARLQLYGMIQGGSIAGAAGTRIIVKNNGANGYNEAPILDGTTTEFGGGPISLTGTTIAITDASLDITGTISNGGTFALASDADEGALEIVQGSAQLQGGGQITMADGGDNVIDAGSGGSAKLVNIDNTIVGNGDLGSTRLVLDNRGVIDATGGSPLFVELRGTTSVNSGTIEATGGGDLEVLRGGFTNSGTLLAGLNASVDFERFGQIINNSGGTLTGGTWQVAAGGLMSLTGGAVVTDAAAISLVGAGSLFQAGNGTSQTTLEASLTTIAATGSLSLTNRSYTTTNAVTLNGILNVGFGTFTSGLITASSTSTIAGACTIASSLTDAGTVNSSYLTIIFTGANDTFSGLLGGRGTIKFASGVDSLVQGASLRAALTQIAGASVTLGSNVTDTGGLALSSGTLALGGFTLSVAKAATLSGGIVQSAGTLQVKGTTTLSGLTLSGAALSNYGTITQTGTLTLAGATGSKDSLINQKGATWALSDGATLILTGSATDLFSNIGTLQKTAGTGTATVGAPLSNTGTISATSGTLNLASAVSGTGALVVGAAGTVELGKSVSALQALTFSGTGGILILDDAHDMHASVTSFAQGDRMDLTGFAVAGETETYATNGSMDAPGGTLSIKGGTATASITLHGTYNSSLFHLASDSHNGTTLTYG